MKAKRHFTIATNYPLISIYFLETPLLEARKTAALQTAVLKVQRIYLDLIQNQAVAENCQFIEALTHDAYVVQIPYLKEQPTSSLEEALMIFNPQYVAKNPHFLSLKRRDLKPKYAIFWRELRRAAANPKATKDMEAEDEINYTLAALAKKMLKYRAQADSYRQQLALKDRFLADKDKRLTDKNKRIAKLEELLQQRRVAPQVRVKVTRSSKRR